MSVNIDELENVRRVAKKGLQTAQQDCTFKDDCTFSKYIDLFQNILDVYERVALNIKQENTMATATENLNNDVVLTMEQSEAMWLKSVMGKLPPRDWKETAHDIRMHTKILAALLELLGDR